VLRECVSEPSRAPKVICVDAISSRISIKEQEKVMSLINNMYVVLEKAEALSLGRGIPLPSAVKEVLDARDMLDQELRRVASEVTPEKLPSADEQLTPGCE